MSISPFFGGVLVGILIMYLVYRESMKASRDTKQSYRLAREMAEEKAEEKDQELQAVFNDMESLKGQLDDYKDQVKELLQLLALKDAEIARLEPRAVAFDRQKADQEALITAIAKQGKLLSDTTSAIDNKVSKFPSLYDMLLEVLEDADKK